MQRHMIGVAGDALTIEGDDLSRVSAGMHACSYSAHCIKLAAYPLDVLLNDLCDVERVPLHLHAVLQASESER